MSAQQNLTNYDLFMLKKKDAKEKLFGGNQAKRSYWKNDAPVAAEKPAAELLFPKNAATVIPAASVTDKPAEKSKGREYLSPKAEKELTYKDYLLNQLSRREPQKILTEDEFYGKVQSASAEQAPVNQIAYMETAPTVKKKNNSILDKIIKKVYGNAEIKKSGKVFMALYVIIVVAVALTLIVTTAAFPQGADLNLNVSASTEITSKETVQPMVIEEEEAESNWFDRLCDSLNK